MKDLIEQALEHLQLGSNMDVLAAIVLLQKALKQEQS